MGLVDSLFVYVRGRTFFYRFTLFTRILLAAGFIPTGAVKLLGRRFTVMSPATPVGSFFEAMYQTGPYWRFLGLAQVVAGGLLLVPRLAHLGAAAFLPIIANIFVLTWALDFGGTQFVTAGMLAATLYLCMWDFHRFRPMLTGNPLDRPVPRHRLDRWERMGFSIFAVALLCLFLMTRGLLGADPALVSVLPPLSVGTGLAAGIGALGRYLWIVRRGRPARLVSEI